ncbi:PLP-dependent aminotransferase family protein [Amycolatopsis acidicola]|uniref:PLP-dependent aminotransferase family protein n=1 Tax=Amycolatopsis acidicola TaxID=2596893 RepID=A0A5N0ULH8_9PSEU|nr:PLP-dependent aminotransferase family protein [Amycolatopsis acidicola]KAA9150001.1 PLP-dependent aminotransferase family protein [Amycolatopsis acidicola]
MELHIDVSDGRELREKISRQIRASILDGRLREGDALPPSRELAQRLAVSRNTVTAAYELLAAEGFVHAKAGAGTFVSSGARRVERPPAEVSELRPAEVWDSVPDPPLRFAVEAEFDFRAGAPDVRLFPFETWRRLVTEQLRGSRPEVLTYGDPRGHAGLRAEIARQLSLSRNVRAGPEDVLVTNGSQQALDLAARVLLCPGDVVAVEDPGYPPPRQLFTTLGARLAAVPVDGEGIVVDRIPAGCRLVYVTPSHQFPLGTSMSPARRVALIEWAKRNDAAILEDDYDTEFRYTGRPLEPLHSLDNAGRVLYVGSFSKVLLPALRLGFLIAPPGLREALGKAKYLTDWHSASVGQAALARFLAEGGFARYVRKMRREYRKRHDLVRRILEEDFAGLLEPLPSDAGLHLSAYSSIDARPVVRAARRAGVRLYALGDFTERRDSLQGLVFGFGSVPLEDIGPGLRRLRGVM